MHTRTNLSGWNREAKFEGAKKWPQRFVHAISISTASLATHPFIHHSALVWSEAGPRVGCKSQWQIFEDCRPVLTACHPPSFCRQSKHKRSPVAAWDHSRWLNCRLISLRTPDATPCVTWMNWFLFAPRKYKHNACPESGFIWTSLNWKRWIYVSAGLISRRKCKATSKIRENQGVGCSCKWLQEAWSSPSHT